MLYGVCVCARACVHMCVSERERERERRYKLYNLFNKVHGVALV